MGERLTCYEDLEVCRADFGGGQDGGDLGQHASVQVVHLPGLQEALVHQRLPAQVPQPPGRRVHRAPRLAMDAGTHLSKQ